MADDNQQQPPPRGLLTQTASVAGKKWGISEWGSVASVIGIGLWLLDQARRERAAERPVPLSNGRIAYAGRVYSVTDPLAEKTG